MSSKHVLLMLLSVPVGLLAMPQPADDPTVASLQNEADKALARGDFRTAEDLFQRGLQIEPAWKDGLWGAGIARYQSGQYPAARDVLLKLTRLDPELGASWAVLGLCEFELADYRNAADHLYRGITLGVPAQLALADVVRFDLAVAHIVLREYAPAASILQGLAKGERDEVERHDISTALGLAYLRIPVLPAAAASQLSADRLSQIQRVGEALYLGGRTISEQAQAAAIFNGLFAKYPQAPELHYAYASLLLDRSDFSHAESELQRELDLNPRSIDARLGFAYLGLQTGETAKALPFAREAAAMNPSSPLAHLYLGRLLVKANRLQQGCDELEMARSLAPANVEVRFSLAAAYRQLGRKQEAEREDNEFNRLQSLNGRPGHSLRK